MLPVRTRDHHLMATPVVRLAGPLSRQNQAIVVFGSGLTEAGRPGPGLQARLRRALSLACRYTEADIIVSGGSVSHGRPEADAMAEWLVERGLAPGRIVLESEARYTLDNAERVAPLLVDRDIQRIHLVTEAFHMPRSEALMRGALQARGVSVELQGWAAPDASDPPGRAEGEAEKLVRDLRAQADLHGLQRRTPCARGPAVHEWWA